MKAMKWMTSVAVMMGLLAMRSAQAATYYLDVNSTTNGSGIVEGGSYAVSGTYWTTTAAGTGTLVNYVDRNSMVFAAGTDATGLNYTITGSISQPNLISIEEGIVTLAATWSAYSSPTIRTADGTSLAITGSNDFYGRIIPFDTIGSSTITLNSISTTSGRRGGVLKTGTGTLIVQNAASARGIDVFVTNGIMRIQNGNAMFVPAYPNNGYAAMVTTNGTLALENNINVANTALSLCGFGYNGLGVLNNYAGTNQYTWPDAITLKGDTRINASAGQLTFAKGFFTNNYILVFGGAGVLIVSNAIHTGTGSLIKVDTGDLTLAGTNSYSGYTLVSNGTVSVKGTLATAKVTVSAPATLTGSGTLHWNPGEVVTVLGALDITQMNMVLHASDALPAGDTVIVDYSSSGSTLTGSTFANVNRDEIASESKLVYDTGLKKIVLRTPPRGTMISFH